MTYTYQTSFTTWFPIQQAEQSAYRVASIGLQAPTLFPKLLYVCSIYPLIRQQPSVGV